MFKFRGTRFLAAGLLSAAALAGCDDTGTTPDSQPPAAPTGVTATLSGMDVTVSWAAVTGATSYRVQRRTVGGASFADIASSVTTTTYSDTAVQAGSTYQYQVIAVNSDGNSAASSLAEVEVPEENRTAILSGPISGDRQLSADTLYIIQGLVTVESGGVLRIPAGTELQGDVAVQPTAVIVRVGGQIFSEGTATNPVVFTSSAPVGQRVAGDWGGLVINGQSQCNFPASQCVGEGSSGQYGGSVLDDNSGRVVYTRIEYAGFEVSFGNELNALTLNGVGSGTEIHHVQTHDGLDDGFEWFGGTVNTSYLIATDISDDSFDYSTGWAGTGQFWIAQQNPDDADNGFEVDGNEDDFNAMPLTNPYVWNVTLIGKGAGGQGGTAGESTRGILLRRGVAGMVGCGIVTGFGTAGLDFDNPETISNGAAVTGMILFDNAKNLDDDSDGIDEAALFAADASNREVDPMLAQPFDRAAPDFRPDAAGPAASGCTAPPPGSGLEVTTYIGAVDPASTSPWYMEGWTRWGDPNAG